MKISPFQVVVLSIFGISIVAGVLVLALSKGSAGSESVNITIWGTISDSQFKGAISDIVSGNDKNTPRITYVEKRQESLDHDLIEAIASGTGPDVVLLPQDMIVRFQDKIVPIPYSTLSLADFKNTFIQESELFLNSSGILGVPFSIDPLVMYWNRDILTSAGIATPPKTWDEFITLVPRLTTKDAKLNILKSGLAFGEYRNVNNAKEIVSALLLQSGSTITPNTTGALKADLGTIGAINFYTDFANPVKPNYSWNRALPNSLDMFVSGDLAFYFGFASEVSKIRDRNSNLNFDVTYFPQPKSAVNLITFGKMYGFVVLRTSSNYAESIRDILTITDVAPISKFSSENNLPPVRRSLVNTADPSNPYQSIFNNSALRARAWLDPNPAFSGNVFKDFIEAITSGQMDVGSAIGRASKDLSEI